MSGMNDNVAVLGDWMILSPRSRAFVSAPPGDYCDSQLNAVPSHGSRKDGFIPDTREHIAPDGTTKKDLTQWGLCRMEMTECSSFSEQKSSRGGLGGRLADRVGFNAPRLNTESIKSSGLLLNSEVRSPYLTIPPGLSPTTLLESPILLSNARAQPSPTTGQFPLVPNDNNKGSLLMSEALDKSKDNLFEGINSSTFAFNPAADSGFFYIEQTNKTNSASLSLQSFPSTEVSVQADNKSQLSETTKDMFQWSTQNVNGINTVAGDKGVLDKGVLDAAGGSATRSPSLDEQQDERDQKGSGESGIAGGGGSSSDDGYNWRKYGQKQVKGSEYPRSYYKCTHPNCQVKKKVERSHEGHITEIIYKGTHNHPKPPPNRRTAIGSSSNLLDLQLDFHEQGRQHSDANGDPSWGNMQKGNASGNPEMGNDNVEVTSSAPTDPEFCNPNGKRREPGDAGDVSSTFSNEEDDDVGTHGSVSLAYDGDEDESESKRRKLEASAAEMSGASRAFREPRVVVQTTSDIDILEDGYRWRKYGQKVVKGNPNPRSYYKCTSPGCTVRKHVERAANDLKSVITTYEGKHNHDVPAARNSNHVNSSAAAQMNQAAAAAAAAQSNLRRPESLQVQNSMARFERSPSFNSFGLPGRPHLNPSPGFSFGMNQGLANIHMAGLGSGQSKMPFLPVHPFLSRPPMNDMGFMLPKDPRMESMPEPGLNLSPSSSLYQQLVGRLPLGPQL